MSRHARLMRIAASWDGAMTMGCSGRKRHVRALINGYRPCLLVRAVILDRLFPRIDIELLFVASATSTLVPTLDISRRCVARPRDFHVTRNKLVYSFGSGIVSVELLFNDSFWDAPTSFRMIWIETG